MQTKSTLNIYNLHKREIKEESWVDNTLGSKLILRARTNSLTLNWRNRFQNKSEQCPCCEYEKETLEHFLLDCETYSDIRQNQTLLFNTENENRNKLIGNLLVFETLSTEEIENRKECDQNLEKKTRKDEGKRSIRKTRIKKTEHPDPRETRKKVGADTKAIPRPLPDQTMFMSGLREY